MQSDAPAILYAREFNIRQQSDAPAILYAREFNIRQHITIF